MMTALLLSLLLVFSPEPESAKASAPVQARALEEFNARVQESRVAFDYTLRVQGELPMSGKGHVSLEGERFTINGNGLEIWSDGVSRWTVDHETQECYIEIVDPSSTDYISNPARLVGSLGSAFSHGAERTSKFGEHIATAVTLTPSIPDTGLKQVIVYLREGSLIGAEITLSDGTLTVITISAFTFSPASGQVSDFSFDPTSLPSEYVVTDLR